MVLRVPILIFVFSLSQLAVKAQKLILSIENINYESQGFQYAATFIKQSLEKNFLRNKGITIVDRDQTHQVLKERELQKNESFIDGVTVKQDKALGAQYIIKCSHVKEKNELLVKIINVETGALTLTRKLDLAGFVNPSNYKISREDYFDRYIKEQVQELKAELGFQPEINIYKLETYNKKESVLLYCKEGCDIKTGDELMVYYETKENGVLMKEIIGKIKVTAMESKEICRADIKEGKNMIKEQIHKNLKCYVQD